MLAATGVLVPFLGTMSGSAMVFLMGKKLDAKLGKLLPGFASGIMLAASVWSLLLPAIDMSEELGVYRWFPAASGFMAGVIFLACLDKIIFCLKHNNNTSAEMEITDFKKSVMLPFAVTLHNIPEGMAVGVAIAGALAGNAGMTIAGAYTLAIGIAIQNFPEGAIVSMPLKNDGMSTFKSFLSGTLSGIVEPVFAVITIALVELVVPLLPYLLAFAAGAMIYVVAEELIPAAQSGDSFNMGTMGVALGFVVMMVLDISFG